MEIFYSADIYGNSSLRLGPEESQHCAKVLRKRVGDAIDVIDGEGALYHCTVVNDSPKGVEANINEVVNNWHSHPYNLTLAVCPTKNNDRYEWFAEKATEFGTDCFVPVIGEHSERKVFKTERLRKIVLSATKQSLKARLAEVREPLSVKEFIRETAVADAVKLIAYCFEEEGAPRRSIKAELAKRASDKIIVLIGPEGDFSREEAAMAMEAGYVPVHIGDSRLRTETAGIAAASAVYFEYL
ncbi:MAG: 16S rRNA (uracil(1498)-N(3))-methyltransferase [Bacteroidales bacterium]|nr:16S rRNA (uracil(1498)-N(3))-methyltransferase [Bacteroidales bacterium]